MLFLSTQRSEGTVYLYLPTSTKEGNLIHGTLKGLVGQVWGLAQAQKLATLCVALGLLLATMVAFVAGGGGVRSRAAR